MAEYITLIQVSVQVQVQVHTGSQTPPGGLSEYQRRIVPGSGRTVSQPANNRPRR